MSIDMIDREARNKLAELLRGLASGLITNDEFEESIPDSPDRGIWGVFREGGWLLYSDLKSYKLKGKDALDKVIRKEVARWVLFLKSNNEYVWPTVTLRQRLLHFITFGKLGTTYKKSWSEGDLDAWPFFRFEHFEKAKAENVYLGK